MTETARIDIAKPTSEVWALVGEFGGLDTWMDGVDRCTVEGDVRTVETMGLTITERLVSRDPDARAITYAVFGEGAPVTAHEATITVHEAGSDTGDAGSEVTWEVTVEPAEAEPLFRDIYQRALDSLKAAVEG